MPHTQPLCTFDTVDTAEAALGRELGAPTDASDREAQLYAKYVRALALLCECAPYVDEPDYTEQIEALLAEACARRALEGQPLTG